MYPITFFFNEFSGGSFIEWLLWYFKAKLYVPVLVSVLDCIPLCRTALPCGMFLNLYKFILFVLVKHLSFFSRVSVRF